MSLIVRDIRDRMEDLKDKFFCNHNWNQPLGSMLYLSSLPWQWQQVFDVRYSSTSSIWNLWDSNFLKPEVGEESTSLLSFSGAALLLAGNPEFPSLPLWVKVKGVCLCVNHPLDFQLLVKAVWIIGFAGVAQPPARRFRAFPSAALPCTLSGCSQSSSAWWCIWGIEGLEILWYPEEVLQLALCHGVVHVHGGLI